MAKQSWDAWTTIPSPTNAYAFIGNKEIGHTFRFNPDTVNWNYKENIASVDTIGGRVTQLLSIQLTGLTINGRAGNRGELQRVSTNLKTVMGYHTNTLNPVHFKVPSKHWDFVGYVVDVSQLGWEIASTSYPYQIQFAVEDDITGIKTKQISEQVINNLQKDIGYDKGHHGGNAQEFYAIVETLSKAGVSSNTTGSAEPLSGEYEAQAQALFDQVKEQFPKVSNWGIFDCRHKNGASGWSNHAWGAAVDIGVSPTLGDQVYAWLEQNKQTLGYYNALWEVPLHYDHIHVDIANPSAGGATPPCAA